VEPLWKQHRSCQSRRVGCMGVIWALCWPSLSTYAYWRAGCACSCPNHLQPRACPPASEAVLPNINECILPAQAHKIMDVTLRSSSSLLVSKHQPHRRTAQLVARSSGTSTFVHEHSHCSSDIAHSKTWRDSLDYRKTFCRSTDSVSEL
jgi:hypothetical protein